MKIVGIDPGNRFSGFCICSSDLRPLRFGKVENDELISILGELIGEADDCYFAIEKLASYGMAVGQEVLDTCEVVGEIRMFLRMNHFPEATNIFRREEKINLCHSMKANDSTIRQALVDRFAYGVPNKGKGTKKEPGWFYGFKADIWAAYAVAVTYHDIYLVKRE